MRDHRLGGGEKEQDERRGRNGPGPLTFRLKMSLREDADRIWGYLDRRLEYK